MDSIYLKHINKQISILKKSNLNIDDYEFIEYILKNENFYGIINGYKKPFLLNQNCVKSKYIDKATFENIYALYEFDMELKLIILKYLIKVESIFKSIIYQIFYMHHGDKPPLKKSSFSALYDDIGIDFINRKILTFMSHKSDITYYYNKYGVIPLWSIINVLNIEELYNFFLLMKDNEKEEVAKLINMSLNKNELKKYFNILIEAKKTCIENIPMYNFKSSFKLNFIDIYSSFNYFPESKSNVFTIIVILKIVLTKEDFKDVYKCISIQLDYLKNSLKNLSYDSCYEKICEKFLGIPSDSDLTN